MLFYTHYFIHLLCTINAHQQFYFYFSLIDIKMKIRATFVLSMSEDSGENKCYVAKNRDKCKNWILNVHKNAISFRTKKLIIQNCDLNFTTCFAWKWVNWKTRYISSSHQKKRNGINILEKIFWSFYWWLGLFTTLYF